jgi:hypothetical protein
MGITPVGIFRYAINRANSAGSGRVDARGCGAGAGAGAGALTGCGTMKGWALLKSEAPGGALAVAGCTFRWGFCPMDTPWGTFADGTLVEKARGRVVTAGAAKVALLSASDMSPCSPSSRDPVLLLGDDSLPVSGLSLHPCVFKSLCSDGWAMPPVELARGRRAPGLGLSNGVWETPGSWLLARTMFNMIVQLNTRDLQIGADNAAAKKKDAL